MVEKREVDEGRLIDQTLRLFQNAIAESETVVPPARFGCAVEGKDLRLSKPPEKRAGSLIGDIVAFARTVAGFEKKAPHTSASLRPPAPKSAGIEPVENVRSDPSVGRMLSAAPIVQLDEPYVAGAARPPSFAMNEAEPSPRQTLGKSASKDGLHLEGPIQERPRAPIDHGHSPRVAKTAAEKPGVDERSDLRVDRVRSTHATVAIDESNVVGAVAPTSLSMAETTAASLRQSVDKPVSRNALTLESPTQEKPPHQFDLDHPPSVIMNAAEERVDDERSAPLVDQPLSMVEFVPIDESNAAEATLFNLVEVGAASIRQPVAKPASRALPLEHSAQKESPVAINDAHSLVVKRVVIFEQKAVLVKRLLVSEPTAAQLGPPSLQLYAELGPEKPVLDALSDPLVDQTLSMIADDKPNAVEAVPPHSANGSEGPLLKPIDDPASRDISPSARPVQEISLIDHALSLVKGVVISERNTVLVKRVAISEFNEVNAVSPSLQSPVDKLALEKPDGALQSEALVDHAPSMIAIVSIAEANMIESAPPASFNAAETRPLSLRRPIDRSALKDMRVVQEGPPSIDRTYPAAVGGAPTALTTEKAVSFPEPPFIRQLSPEDRLDEELADIRRRVAAFKEHQQRFRREREEYYAATMARAWSNPVDASDRSPG